MMVLDYLALGDRAHVACISSKFYRIATPYVWGILPELEGNPHFHSLLSSETHLPPSTLVRPFLLEYTTILIDF